MEHSVDISAAAAAIDHGLVGELAPGTTYQVLLFTTASSGTK